ncbi:hypothetical protein HS125_09320 [bacterium]|nr:hypothetical protein [bacterium]
MTTLAARTLGLLLFLAPLVSAATTPVALELFEGTVESSSGHAGTAQNVTFVPGHRDAGDQAAYFNGTNAKVQYAASSLWTFNHNQSFTLDFISRPASSRP